MIETGFVDIHTHIIPGVDDGSANMERSLEMVRLAYNEGVRVIYATPHFGVRNPSYDWNKADKNFNELADKVKELYPDMELHYGCELYCGPGMIAGLNDGYARKMSEHNHAMIEFSSRADYEEIFHGCRSLIREGYQPILAHAERYRNAFRKVKNVADICAQDVLVQMNTISVLDQEELFTVIPEFKVEYDETSLLERGFRKKADREQYKFCQRLITEGLVTFMGTDCHDMLGRKPLVRGPYERVIDLVGEARADDIFRNNALELLL